MNRPRERNTVGGDLLRGGIAGLIGVWVLDRLDNALFDSMPIEDRRRTAAARPGGMDPAHVIANRFSRRTGLDFGNRRDNPAGRVIHYGLGAMMGSVYGAMLGRIPAIGGLGGLGYGLAMWLLQDEGLNTIMGTAGRPSDYPWQDHARGAAAHALFGVVTDTTVRVLR